MHVSIFDALSGDFIAENIRYGYDFDGNGYSCHTFEDVDNSLYRNDLNYSKEELEQLENTSKAMLDTIIDRSISVVDLQ
ncbi:hypothetical protein L4D21_27735 [Photobacterium profundum]|uniref:hypothetical protein n=1 Tax=Photobacterium profundum TaxID=74109 RepID=UPI003D11A54F